MSRIHEKYLQGTKKHESYQNLTKHSLSIE